MIYVYVLRTTKEVFPPLWGYHGGWGVESAGTYFIPLYNITPPSSQSIFLPLLDQPALIDIIYPDPTKGGT